MHSDEPSVFFAYPSTPASCDESMRIASSELRGAGIVGVTWRELNPAGRLLIDTITAQIDQVDAVVAEVSSMNRNVLFEAGYALAKNKKLLLAVDESLDSARRLWDGVQLLSSIGRLDYHGNGAELARQIISSFETAQTAESLLAAVLAEGAPQQMDAVFAPTVPVRFQAADMLDKELNNRGSIHVLASGDDLGLAPLSYYAQEIFRSSAAIFHLMNPDRTRANEHNARASFLAGFAYGWQRPTLMLAEWEYASPLDYRDILFNYQTAAKMVRRVDDWLSSLPLQPGSSRRLGRLALQLDLPVSSFGQYVAENEDSRLDQYFLPTHEFASLTRGEASVFVGRKGTGKTATMIQAAADLSKDRRNFVVKVKPSSYELSGLVDLVARFEVRSGGEYLLNSLWMYLLTTEVAVQLVRSAEATRAGIGGSTGTVALDRRLEQMGVNRGDMATRLEDAVSAIANRACSAPVGEFRDTVASALRSHWLKDLQREIREATKSKYGRIAILVDNLDKAWERGADFEVSSRLLLALLSAMGQFRRALEGGDLLDVTLGIFIRADIYEVMTSYAREPDKIGPLVVQWTDRHLLARVLEERYAANRRRQRVGEDMWATIFPSEVHGLPTKDYLLWRILPRPRDVIYFGNAALTTAINRHHSIITQDDIDMADEQYSRFAFDALVVESDAQDFDVEELLFAFAGVNATLAESDLIEILAEVDADPNAARSWLLRTSFLGIEIAEGDFRHVEGQAEVDRKLKVARRLAGRAPRELRFRVHPAFRHHLDVRDDDLHTPGVRDVTLQGNAP